MNMEMYTDPSLWPGSKLVENSPHSPTLQWTIGQPLSDFLDIAGISAADIQKTTGNTRGVDLGLPLPNWISLRQKDHNWIYLRDEVADDFVRAEISKMTDQDKFVLADAGERELVERAWLTESIAREITGNDNFSFAGPMSDNYHGQIAAEMQRYLMILPKIESWRTSPPSTLRNVIRNKALRIDDERSQAMTTHERKMFGLNMEQDYLRGNVFRDPLYQDVCNGLLKHYGVETPEKGHVWLTSKGIWSQQIALEAMALSNRDASIIFVGKPYFEVNKRPGRIKNLFGIDLNQRITRVSDESDFSERLSGSQKDLIVYFDPLESYSQCGVRDAESILKTVKEYQARTGKAATVIMDVTTCAGVYPNLSELERRIGSLPDTILAQSLLKYWEWGTDLTQIGSIIAYGPNSQPNGEIYNKLMDYYYFVHADPDLESIARVPPIRSDYMKYRADRISRNMRLITSSLETSLANHDNENLSEVKLKTHRSTNQQVIDNMGFDGPYFFLECPTSEHAKKIIQEIEKTQPNAIGSVDAGVSFGFDKTRAWQLGDTKYIRIVCGTEDIFSTYMVQSRLLSSINNALT